MVAGHGAMPHLANDPVVAAASLVMALQTIVSRSISPLQAAVITVGAHHAGKANDVMPATATLALSVRALNREVRSVRGPERVTLQGPPRTGSEDFAFVLRRVLGSYLLIGNGWGSGMVHHPGRDFNGDNIAVGSAHWVLLTERFLSAEKIARTQ